MMISGRLKSFIPQPGFMTYMLLSLQSIYYVLFIMNSLPGYSIAIADILSMISGLFTLFLFASVLEYCFYNRLLKRIFTPLMLFILWALNAYQLSSGSSLDYALVRDNIGISFSSEALSMISSPFSFSDAAVIIFFLIAASLIEFRFSLSDSEMGMTFKSAASALIFWILLVLFPLQSGDGFTLFAKSIFSGESKSLYAQPVSADYPYDKKNIPLTDISTTVPISKKSKPDIFLILIESFNANFVEAKAPDGIDFTPNFNSLIQRGLYIDRFYGNSIQTCKGQAAVFYSVLPSFKGKIFVDYPDLKISGFPSILADAGYETIFFQAYHNLKFDNTENSMYKAGFSIVKSYSEFRKKEDKPQIWGWGVEDAIFYERFFQMLDTFKKRSPEKPVFAALTTVGTHIPCDGMPPEKRTIYKDPKNIKEKYSNALRLSDSQLPRFFELLKERKYLENSIIIITSDHSFPMKEHGIYNNEVCFYDETFRIPFLVIWDGVIKPERVKNRVYSQIDIGPTITDMLGIKEASHNMTGISMFDRKTDNPVYLIQPYNGRFLQVVDYPFKYITHLKTGKEYLFDLENDPAELVNLMTGEYNAETVKRLKDSLKTVYMNQQLIDSNKIRKKY
jgi:arylsulfatase A-like enzyme